ncbi:MAG: alternative ribosome rescue aminoacyl-tRNA hydrolase ArfB [Planctomycetota bacterium]
MSRALVVEPGWIVDAAELSFSFARSSGPGGQNVNKVNTKATLRWKVGESGSVSPAVRDRFLQRYPHRLNKTGEVVITSDRFREQARNLTDCYDRLRELILSVKSPPRPRKATKPTRASVRRRLEDKRHNSQRKQSRRPPGSD